MALNIDYARLREETMTSGQDSAVTVNTRALIDKVLARYSSEYTTLRELIQNAADAKATKVSIRFETLPSTSVPVPLSGSGSTLLRHTIKHHTVRRLLVSNNGLPFSSADWARLKSIADGNPDETKIGAFGVGFYSVFADCDEPFVVSGQKTMAFFWKGNQLFTRASTLPSEQASSDTCFALEYRQSVSSAEGNSASVPDLMSLCQFLSTSLTFVGLEMLELHVDEWNIATFRKKSSPPATVPIPYGLNPKTEKGIMTVHNITSQTSQIDASWIDAVGWTRDPAKKSRQDQDRSESSLPAKSFRQFLAKLSIGSAGSATNAKKQPAKEDIPQISDDEEMLGQSQASVFVQTVTLDVRTRVPADFSRELERATKKPPPKATRVSVLTTSFGEASSIISVVEGKTASLAKSLFSSVIPQKHGNIFIGFPTNQTTGLLCHISAPSLIPTVERESIDLNARFISTWNYEVLKVAGIGCRIAYHTAMTSLKEKLERLRSTQPLQSAISNVLPDAIHIFKQFTLTTSTPIEEVGATLVNTFWTCVNNPALDIVSTQGVLPSNKVRLVSENLSFLSHLPVVPEELLTDAEGFVSQLFKNGFISNMTVNDIEKELSSRALSGQELMEFLKWCASKVSSDALKQSDVKALFAASIVVPEDGADSEAKSAPISLANITAFLNTSRIGPDMPLPPFTIPFRFTKGMTYQQLKSFGWDELHISPWLRYVIEGAVSGPVLPDSQNILLSSGFAADVLTTVSKGWEQLSQDARGEVTRLLRTHAVIPTTQGMKKPEESYLSSVKAFTDLPIIAVPNIKPKVLTALGIRTTVELDVVFQKLQANRTGEKGEHQQAWSPGEIIKYFASVMKDLPAEDLQRLKETPFCQAEQRARESLFKISDLYVPRDALRSLGLLTIQLPYHYREDTPEGRLLKALGIRSYPSVPVLGSILIDSAEKNDQSLYDFAMEYFISNFYPNGYNKFDMAQFHDLSFLPASQKEFPQLFAPSELYSNPKAQVLGFLALKEELRVHADKFGVASDPAAHLCVQALNSSRPKTPEDARIVFAYLATRVSENDKNAITALGDARIVPVFKPGEKGERFRLSGYRTPKSVFIGRDREYKDLLQYVDFGEEANLFLLKVGSKHEPSSLELVAIVAKDPGKFLRSLGPERYLDLLRKFAERKDQIEADKLLWVTLKRTPFLLAAQDKASEKVKSRSPSKQEIEGDDSDEKIERIWSLEVATDATVIDDVQNYMLFRDHLKTVPQEDLLERFYMALGSPFLSSLVKETVRMGAPLRQQDNAQRLRKEIIERAQIFLYEYGREDPNRIKHDAKWLQNSLRVQEVDHIALHLALKGTPASLLAKQTALYDRSARTLSITRNFDPYDLSRQLISVMINRPKKYEVVAFEQILSEPLKKLGRRGYNVERILRQREYEARVAESERQKQFEEEKAKQELQRSATSEEGMEKPQRPNVGAHGLPPPYEEEPHSPQRTEKMPGAFLSGSPDRPDTGHNPVDTLRNTGQDFFKRVSKRLGLHNAHQPDEQHSPADTPRDPKTQMGLTKSNIAGAIQRCRPLDGTSLHAPATIKNVEEAKGSYCDGTTAKDLDYMEERGGYRCFISRHFDRIGDAELLRHLQNSANDFSRWLRRLAAVFQINQGVHIFYDNHSSTIAFNSGGALFFNAFYFYSIHAKENAKPLAILEYWYLVFCHELAHNLVGEHSASHEFYLQSICYEFRPAFHALLRELEI